MSHLIDSREGVQHLLLGNEIIARGALEAGVRVVTGYPGTPASEVVEGISRVAGQRGIYVEWSVNEKAALEVAAAGSFAGLRTLCAMKQNGVNVGSDFLLHLALSGTRGGMVLVPCEDPGAVSSINEAEARMFSKMLEIPLLEPGDFQELKEMVKWAFELSERIRSVVMVRSVTRLSHGSGNVVLGKLPPATLDLPPRFRCEGPVLDEEEGVLMTFPVGVYHGRLQGKVRAAMDLFEGSPFNTYSGPERPELLVITSSVCHLYCREAMAMLGLEERVGLLKLGTTWPLPTRLLKTHLSQCQRVLVVEEVLPFLEDNLKALAADLSPEIGLRLFHGKASGDVPSLGELDADLVVGALSAILGLERAPAKDEGERGARAREILSALPTREWTFCAGCPHRASFWSIHRALRMDGRQGFVCGDIGCYTMGLLPTGFRTLKLVHAMGSGIGVASGFGQLGPLGMTQPVVAVCGDSTFFHTGITGLINAVHHNASVLFILLDNGGTAMTGFQPHPGTALNAVGGGARGLDTAAICQALGVPVEMSDPFDLEGTQGLLTRMLQDGEGTRVLILRQDCALSPQRKAGARYRMGVDTGLCLGAACGCNRLCTRVFRCPGLVWDPGAGVSGIDEVICTGCGVCTEICPAEAIQKEALP